MRCPRTPSAPAVPGARGQRRLCTGLYGLHCFTSLAYEVVWMGLLAVSLGRTLAAMAIVMMVFMAGLGLGAAVLAWWARSHPVRIRRQFVCAQIVLGICGVAFPWLLGWVDTLYTAVAPAVESLSHHGLRLAVSAGLLLPLTVLMGFIFPLLSAGATGTAPQADDRRSPGCLYWGGLCCSGLGALSAPLGLIPGLGFTGTGLVLGCLNGLAALGGLWLREPQPQSPDHTKLQASAPTPVSARCVCTLGGILGFYLFAVESVAAQYLWLIVDATVYAEGMLLGTTLLSMGAGAALYLGLRRAGWRLERLVVGGLLGGALAQLLWLLLAADIAWAFAGLVHHTAWLRTSAVSFLTAHGLLVLAVLGGPAGAAGLLFPALCEFALLRHGSAAHLVGRLTAWHSLGATLGAAGAVFLMLPLLGMTVSLAMLSALLPLTMVAFGHAAVRRRHGGLLWGSAGVTVAVALWLGGTGDVTFRAQAAGAQQHVLMHHEDGSGIVEVYEDRRTGHRTLLSSRLRQEGGNRPDDLRVQRVQGALPVLLHPQPRRMLVVGLGTGISLAASLRPEVTHLTCVEISRGVLRAAAFFAPANGHVLTHPQVTLVQQDGRNFLKLTQESYDVIVQDLFFPYRSGVGHLYTREHYQRLRSRLTPHGRAAQWIALNQVGPFELRTLIRTFSEVFPHTSLWLTGGYLLLYGGNAPLRLEWPAVQQRFAAAVPVEQTDTADFLGMFLSAGEPVRQWAAQAALNTDDNAVIEFRAPRAFATLNSVSLAVENLSALLPLHRPVSDVLTTLPAPDREQLTRVHQAIRFLWAGIVARARGDVEQARSLYEQAHALNPINYQARSFLEHDLAARGRQALLAGHLSVAASLLSRALALNAQHADAQFDLALVHTRRADYGAAVTHLRHLLNVHPEFPHARFNLGVGLYHLGDYPAAIEQFEHVVAREPTAVDPAFNLANSLAQAGRYAEAVRWYQRTLALNPGHAMALDNLRTLQLWHAAPQRLRASP